MFSRPVVDAAGGFDREQVVPAPYAYENTNVISDDTAKRLIYSPHLFDLTSDGPLPDDLFDDYRLAEVIEKTGRFLDPVIAITAPRLSICDFTIITLRTNESRYSGASLSAA